MSPFITVSERNMNVPGFASLLLGSAKFDFASTRKSLSNVAPGASNHMVLAPSSVNVTLPEPNAPSELARMSPSAKSTPPSKRFFAARMRVPPPFFTSFPAPDITRLTVTVAPAATSSSNGESAAIAIGSGPDSSVFSENASPCTSVQTSENAPANANFILFAIAMSSLGGNCKTSLSRHSPVKSLNLIPPATHLSKNDSQRPLWYQIRSQNANISMALIY